MALLSSSWAPFSSSLSSRSSSFTGEFETVLCDLDVKYVCTLSDIFSVLQLRKNLTFYVCAAMYVFASVCVDVFMLFL